MKVRFIPFGWADVQKHKNGSKRIQCHHKADECYGNQIQACMIKYSRGDAERYVSEKCQGLM